MKSMTSLMEIRKMISAVGEKEGIKITYLPIMIKEHQQL